MSETSCRKNDRETDRKSPMLAHEYRAVKKIVGDKWAVAKNHDRPWTWLIMHVAR